MHDASETPSIVSPQSERTKSNDESTGDDPGAALYGTPPTATANTETLVALDHRLSRPQSSDDSDIDIQATTAAKAVEAVYGSTAKEDDRHTIAAERELGGTSSDIPRPHSERGTLTSSASTFSHAARDITNLSPGMQVSRGESAPVEGMSLEGHSTRRKKWRRVKRWLRAPGRGLQMLGAYHRSKREARRDVNLVRLLETNILPGLLLGATVQRDEHGNPRVPVFLSLIHISISRPQKDENQANDPLLVARSRAGVQKPPQFTYEDTNQDMYKIMVGYGAQPTLIGNWPQWMIYRRHRDFVKLHYRYRGVDLIRRRIPNFPDFPRKGKYRRHRKPKRMESFPYNQPFAMEDDENEPSSNLPPSINAGLSSDWGREPGFVADLIEDPNTLKQRALEEYLYALMHAVSTTAYTNRLCKFLEISYLGLRLTVREPQGYHGKEGYLTITNRSDREVRQTRKEGVCCGLLHCKRKNEPVWCIVRESYLLFVRAPHASEILDVFMFDHLFTMHRSNQEGVSDSHEVKKSKSKEGSKPGSLVSKAQWKAEHTLCVTNSQRTWHLRAKNEQQARQFEESIKHIIRLSPWARLHPFDSFAPIRHSGSATWFVDGRDYFWEISLALENAKDYIYIHDWWLSPEVYLRRPACRNEAWRLDNIIKRKANQGVKIYIIIYKEVAMTLPLSSHYAKKYLMSLSPNIFVQRHPSRAIDIVNKETVFYAHHEKICVVDGHLAFIGGLDLCFGRWDTPRHVVVDDHNPSLEPSNMDPQIWPGKDYSNPRILDFQALEKPFEDNMDRKTLPRMPWHDVSLRLCGQPARDIDRHFVQRWNFLRRSKAAAPKRPTPLLLPRADRLESLDEIRNDPYSRDLPTAHVCCTQIMRSASLWSLGIREHVEHSIENGYVKLIERSDYFVYIENQFFVTSTDEGSVLIANRVGHALTNRVIRAKQENKYWRAIIVLPLVPGFQSGIHEAEGSTVRIIMHCQYQSIKALFKRLQDASINPHEYISFYGLRNWGELNGRLVTEQVYVHAKVSGPPRRARPSIEHIEKVLIADDRSVIIGSANINERSQLGSRDSEIAACIHDTETTESTIAGKRVKIGRFAHSLRMRLMCEHVGLDIDSYDQQNAARTRKSSSKLASPMIRKGKESTAHPLRTDVQTKSRIRTHPCWCTKSGNDTPPPDLSPTDSQAPSPSVELSPSSGQTRTRGSRRGSQPSSPTSQDCDAARERHAAFWAKLRYGEDDTTSVDKYAASYYRDDVHLSPESSPKVSETAETEHKEPDWPIFGSPDAVSAALLDPLSPEFHKVWHWTARHNTHLFRQAFLVVPDNNVRTWEDYEEFQSMAKECLGRKDINSSGTLKTATLAGASRKKNVTTIDEILQQVQGHLVIWPIHFLEDADERNEFLQNRDKIAPIEIFN